MSPLDYSTPEEHHEESATSRVIDGLKTFGYTPSADEIDHRPPPDDTEIDGAISAMFQVMADTLHDTSLEPHLEDILWQLTNVFHRQAAKQQRKLDDNEARQRSSQELQDGSEIRSVELENLVAHGQAIIDHRDIFENSRDIAAESFRAITGTAWRPHSGSMANRKAMTASVIDSRDFINSKRYKETNTLTPPGTLIALSGGIHFNDTDAIYRALDSVHSRNPDMILIHGGYHSGADKIASTWARNRGVTEMPFAPDFKKHANRAGFVRNDEIIKLRPRGIIVFDGTGVQHQIAREAKKANIPVNDYRTDKGDR